ncbi:MAG: hypothetical protein H7Y09_07685, partial [Chitinophagaceae bacterium]|nr:hypothetical protein [Anaerolineae bacterium]
MLAADKTRSSQLKGIDLYPIYIVSAVLFLLSLGAFAYVVNTLAQAAETYKESSTGTVILGYLNDTGLILPLLAIGFGIWLFQLGLGVYQRKYPSAAWARMLFLWLMVGIVALLIRDLIQIFGGNSSAADMIGSLALWLILILSIGYCMWWLAQNINTAFVGQESLFSASTRTAWNLLVPTVFVLILVAARPLEQTFIASLTDARFASADEVNFVGFDNYAQLLGFRFDRIGCEQDADG